MCGRFTLSASAHALETLFDVPVDVDPAPRYNIAPTQPVAIVRMNHEGNAREWTHVRWGLIPSWSKDPTIGARMINARAETVAEKPSFRAAYKRRRCLVPTTGFYEWTKVDGGKQPHFITIKGDNGASDLPFAIAGLWESWNGPDGVDLQTCTLLTTAANEFMQPLHHRMPVILEPEDYAMWLTTNGEDKAELSMLQHLLRAYPSAQMAARPVSKFVNNARNEGVECIAPLAM